MFRHIVRWWGLYFFWGFCTTVAEGVCFSLLASFYLYSLVLQRCIGASNESHQWSHWRRRDERISAEVRVDAQWRKHAPERNLSESSIYSIWRYSWGAVWSGKFWAIISVPRIKFFSKARFPKQSWPKHTVEEFPSFVSRRPKVSNQTTGWNRNRGRISW